MQQIRAGPPLRKAPYTPSAAGSWRVCRIGSGRGCYSPPYRRSDRPPFENTACAAFPDTSRRRRAGPSARESDQPDSGRPGIAQYCLHRSLRQADIDQGQREGLTAEERGELVGLQRANWMLAMEVEVLEGAIVLFAREQLA